jgi:hypothetical protein
VRLLFAVIGAVLLAAPALRAQQMRTLDSGFTEGLGKEDRANRAYAMLIEGRNLAAREIAQEILAKEAESFRGHYLLGTVLRRAEANLPLALYHLKRARQSFEAQYGTLPGDGAPWRWHASALDELVAVTGEMERFEEQLVLIGERDRLYLPHRPGERAWPLMRLRRYDEARAAVEEGIKTRDPEQTSVAQTALCAIESELQRRDAAYRACLAATRQLGDIGGQATLYTNASESALGLLKMDEAERLLLEAARHFQSGVASNPWLNLVWLYLAEGRTAEALSAAREMINWRVSQPAYMDEQTRAWTDLAAAMFLVVLGRGEEAARVTGRTLLRPDRTGFTSAESAQMEAGTAFLDRQAALVAAERKAEEASWLPWRDAIRARAAAARFRLRAWSSGRRAAALIADDRRLVATLRPYLAGGVGLPEWLEGDLCRTLGAAALRRARVVETLPAAGAYFDAFEAEVALLQGRRSDAVRFAERALQSLPRREVLLQARVAAVGAQAARDDGDGARGLAFLLRALQLDAGVVRRLGLALPAAVSASGGAVATQAAAYLERSPRFTRERPGFRIEVTGDDVSGAACLVGPQGERLACGTVTPRAGEDGAAIARRLAAEFHAQVFAPRVDLTQADLRSLDGSTTAGRDRGNRRIQGILDVLTGGTPR